VTFHNPVQHGDDGRRGQNLRRQTLKILGFQNIPLKGVGIAGKATPSVTTLAFKHGHGGHPAHEDPDRHEHRRRAGWTSRRPSRAPRRPDYSIVAAQTTWRRAAGPGRDLHDRRAGRPAGHRLADGGRSRSRTTPCQLPRGPPRARRGSRLHVGPNPGHVRQRDPRDDEDPDRDGQELGVDRVHGHLRQGQPSPDRPSSRPTRSLGTGSRRHGSCSRARPATSRSP
jgi:hypothetical protein